MLKLTTDLVVLLCVLGTTAVVLLGWGNLTWRILGVARPSKVSVITIWLGFCIVVGCLEFIHLFVPIDWRVTVGVAIVGLLGQAGLFKSKATLLKPEALDRSNAIGLVMITLSAVQRYPWRSLAAMVVIVTWCLRAMETPTMYDSGLYHFGSIRWLNEYPIVPGLGNLHWRLALNQSYFGFLALLNFAPYWGKGYAAGGLFLLLLTAFTVLEIGLNQSRLWRWIFGGILFSYLCLLSGPIANPMPDTVVALLQIVIFIYFYCSLIQPFDKKTTCQLMQSQILVVLLFLNLTVVTTKLSSVAFAFTTVVLLLLMVFIRNWTSLSPKQLRRLTLLLIFFSVLHFGRSFLLSGAPFFPNPIGGVWSLPWAVEYGVAHNESQLIYAWAKQPGIASADELRAGYAWFGPWFLSLSSTFKRLLLVSTLIFGILIVLHRSAARILSYKIYLAIAPVMAALCFWFFSAPDPRFLGSVVILFFSWACWVLFECTRQMLIDIRFRHLFKKNLVKSGALVICSCCIFFFIKWSLLGMAYPNGWQSVVDQQITHHQTRSGLDVYTPITGAQCWNARLPCAVLAHDGLRELSIGGLIRLGYTTR
jgi:hypothetical protein